MTGIQSLPDNIRLWPQWLESLIVSPHLADLVDELQLPPGINRSNLTLASICGQKLPQVLEQGLSVLDDQQLMQLLDHPHLLFDLQQQAFEACSPYWDQLASGAVDQATPDGQAMGESRAVGIASNTDESPTINTGRIWSDRKFWPLLALAAGLLLAVGVWLNRPAPTPTGWGLAKIDSLSPALKDSTYLQRLAELAAQWNNKQPTTSENLLQRLREYRTGCQMLIEHPKPQLKPEDRQWLVTKCQKWAGDLDQLITKLESSQISFDDASQEALAIAGRMETVLRDKALELS
ncbi:MAG: hypothetical protein IT423_12640 [Pirellulaceae bacterium]|nr:hypothetical protein [Pirellulaceae bacterium]